MTEILADLFNKVDKTEIDKACYLALGRLAPKYEGIEFNMGDKLMIRAIAKASKKDEKEVAKIYKQTGDLGNTIYKLKSPITNHQSPNNLSVNEIYEKLLNIANDSGEGSVDRKINNMSKLLSKVEKLSAKYIARIPVNKLRLGFSDMTILDSLSWMKTGDKSLRKELERAFNVLADIGKIAIIFKSKGIKGIKSIKSEIGIPIRPALAERLRDPAKILEKMDGKTALEPKMDGFRVQLHIDKSRKLELKDDTNLFLFKDKKQCFVRIFSRNLDNTTYMFPDVVKAAQNLKVKSAIFDGEAIAYDKSSGKFLSFQQTVQRKRKHGIKKKAQEIPLKVFLFDILYLNGKPLFKKPFNERRKKLKKILEKSKGEEKGIQLTRQKIVTKPEQFNNFFEQIVSEGLEGLMAKKTDAPYDAGARGYTWVKYKVAMQSELADTIDCIVMGYYRGKGKRSKFGIGAFLVGVLSMAKGQRSRVKYVTVSKIGTGLTDEQWREMHKRLEKLKTDKKPQNYQIDKNLNPDIWCKPELVVEIEADEITKSPIHTAGLALRFPRLKRFRDDKDPDQATSLKEVQKIKNQP